LFRKLILVIFPKITHGLTTKKYGFYLTQADNGRSGQSFERPAFIQMIADMESGKINCCITKDLSRLGRNAIDTGYYIEKYFPTHGIRYIAITDDYDSAKDNNSIMVSLKNMINEVYALEAGRKTWAAKQLSINSGKFIRTWSKGRSIPLVNV